MNERDKAREAAWQREYAENGLEPPKHESEMWKMGFDTGFDAGLNYDPPPDPEFDGLLKSAIDDINDKYRQEGFEHGRRSRDAEVERLKDFFIKVAYYASRHDEPDCGCDMCEIFNIIEAALSSSKENEDDS